MCKCSLFCEQHEDSVNISLTHLSYPPGALLLHETPLHSMEVCLWCTVNAEWITGFILYKVTNNFDSNVTLQVWDIISSTSDDTVQFISLLYGAILDLYHENLLALGSVSSTSCQELASGSCAQVYHHCRINLPVAGDICIWNFWTLQYNKITSNSHFLYKRVLNSDNPH